MGASLLLDIAGFTPIVVALSGAGPRGIDALQRLLSSYFTEMIEAIRDYGGDIYQFAGDSVLALFEPDRGGGRGRGAAGGRGVRTDVQSKLARFASVELLGQRFALSSRIGIGFGECHRIILGAPASGCTRRWWASRWRRRWAPRSSRPWRRSS